MLTRQTAHHRNGSTRGADWRGCCSRERKTNSCAQTHTVYPHFLPAHHPINRLWLERGETGSRLMLQPLTALKRTAWRHANAAEGVFFSVELVETLLVGLFVSPRLYVRPACLAHSCVIPFLVSDLHGSIPRFPFPPITSQSPASI